MIQHHVTALVEEKLVKIGDAATPNTVLVVLSNPDLVQQVANQELAYSKRRG